MYALSGSLVIQHIPRSVRGAVMGFGLRAPNNTVALEIGFGSPYASYSLALLRVFRSVSHCCNIQLVKGFMVINKHAF